MLQRDNWAIKCVTQQAFIYCVLEAGKSKTRGQHSWILLYRPSYWLADRCLSPVPSHGREKKALESLLLLIWALIHHRLSALWPHLNLSGSTSGQGPACQSRRHKDAGSIPGLGRSLGEGNGNPFQYSCLENPMERGGWHATVYRDAKGWTQLKQIIMQISVLLRMLNSK